MNRVRVFILCLVSIGMAAPEAPTSVFVEPAKKAQIADVLSYPARVIPKINASLISEAEGVITKIIAPLGIAVRPNQKLIQIKNTDPVYNYAPYYVEAPVGGVVSLLEVSEGSRVSKGTKLGTITDPARITINIEIAAADLSVLSRGQSGELRAPHLEGTVPVKILGISPFVDPATGTATAELSLTDPKKPVPPGSVGSVIFKVREHSGILVAENALYYRGKNPFVGVVVEGKAKYVPVVLGQTRRGMAEVLEGIREGDQLIIRASGFITDGDAVTPQENAGEKKT